MIPQRMGQVLARVSDDEAPHVDYASTCFWPVKNATMRAQKDARRSATWATAALAPPATTGWLWMPVIMATLDASGAPCMPSVAMYPACAGVEPRAGVGCETRAMCSDVAR